MTLKEKIIETRDTARKNKNVGGQITLDTCNMLLSKITNFETSGKERKEADDNNVIQILQQYKKQVNEELDIATKNNLSDRINKHKKELYVVNQFLPTQISDEGLKNLIEGIRSELDNNKGKIIGKVKQLLGGRADGKRISEMVNKIIG